MMAGTSLAVMWLVLEPLARRMAASAAGDCIRDAEIDGEAWPLGWSGSGGARGFVVDVEASAGRIGSGDLFSIYRSLVCVQLYPSDKRERCHLGYPW